MAKVMQIIDVDSDGHKVRLDDGRVVVMPHGGDHPHIGQEFTEITQPVSDDGPMSWLPGETKADIPAGEIHFVKDGEILAKIINVEEEVHAPTVEQLNSDAQAQAQDLSAIVNQAETETQ